MNRMLSPTHYRQSKNKDATQRKVFRANSEHFVLFWVVVMRCARYNLRMQGQQELSKIIKTELERAKQKNARFSLRSLSKRLRVSPSLLSDLLSGKRRVTLKTAQKLLTGLGANPELQARILANLGTVSKVSHAQQSQDAQKKYCQTYRPLELDEFHFISDWFYMAVYILAETDGFVADPQWISQKLGITLREAKIAITRLVRLGVWCDHPQQGITSTRKSITTTVDIPDGAIQGRHRQFLALAERAIDERPVEERDFSAMTMASSLDRLAKAKIKIENFRRELCEFLEDIPENQKTEVLQLNVQLFPIGNTIKKTLKEKST